MRFQHKQAIINKNKYNSYNNNKYRNNINLIDAIWYHYQYGGFYYTVCMCTMGLWLFVNHYLEGEWDR